MITATEANYISSGKQEKDKLLNDMFNYISKKITKIATNKRNLLVIMFNDTKDNYNKESCINFNTSGYNVTEINKAISTELKENGFIVKEGTRSNKNDLCVKW